MKKITAFFLALFPLIVIVLLFVSGMLVKDYTHVFVTAVEFDRDSLVEKCPNNTPYPTNNDGKPVVEQLYAHVLPFNATEPTIYYMSTNEDVATIDDNGLLTVKDFGETDIIAVSKENKNITATCPVKITDDKIHRIEITNAPKHNCYVGQNETMQLDANPIPYDDLAETIDPTVSFIAPATNVLDVTTDGLLIAHDESTEESAPIEVTYCVEEQIGQPEIRDTVNVNVGLGVTAIEFDNPDEFTTKDHFDLFDEMKIFPEETESGRIKPSDFEYVSTKPEIATIDENGKVQFLKPGECEFNITYVYKPSLTLRKKITSTCQNAADVAFNCYSFTDKYENYTGGEPYIDENNINWNVFPNDPELLAKAKITSSNPNVVKVENRRLRVTGVGYTTLSAEVKIGDEAKKIDNCVVHITSKVDPSNIFKEESVFVHDSYLYPLRNNLNLDALPSKNVDIKWTVQKDIDKQYVNSESLKQGMLCWTHSIESGPAAHPIPIVATFEDIDGTEISKSFLAVWEGSTEPETITVEEGKNVVITAGKKYRFVDKNGVDLHPNVALIQSDFDYNAQANTLIPYWGFNCGEMYLYYDKIPLIPDMTINVVVEQDAVSIIADDNYPFFTTTETNLNISPTPGSEIGTGQIGVYPNTATKADGSNWTPDFTFEFDTPETGTIGQTQYGYQVRFNQAGYVNINASLNGQTENYILKSTFNRIGKFSLVDSEGQRVQSGQTITLSPDMTTPITYQVDTIELSQKITSFEGYFDPKDIKYVSNDALCNVVHSEDETQVTFYISINPEGRGCGSDVIMIDEGDFIFYINVKIEEPAINKFNLYYHGQKLKSGDNINISYIDSLVLNVESLPLVSEDSVSATYNSEPIDIVNNKIVLNMDIGENTIVLSSDHTGYSETFKINHLSPSAITDFSIKEADSNTLGQVNTLYFPCAKTQCGLTIQIGDALVDEDFYEDNFDWELEEGGNESVDIVNNHIVVSHIPAATVEHPGYKKVIKILYKKAGGDVIKEYQLNREEVSRIVLPDHDNAKLSDQKGFQKVHVYGNQSMYSSEEGILDYYCLPIEIYDYRHHLIADPEEKARCYSQLHIEMSSYHHTYARPEYDATRDCIKIKFSKDDLYTPYEMYENKFELKYKNVTIKIETPSKLARAKYEFIPVEGINAYCQDAFMDRKNAVLQSNVGLEDDAKDNIPFKRTDEIEHIGTLYGNGYTACFESAYLADNIRFAGLFNTTIKGASDAQIKAGADIDFEFSKMGDGDWEPRYAAYDTFTNFSKGAVVFGNVVGYLKNNLLFNNTLQSLSVSGTDAKGYIEDCVLFNCSSTALTSLVGAELFLKGFIDVYNFRNKDCLQNILGHDYSFLWDVIAPLVRSQGGMQMGADGREYFNSFMLTYQGKVAFWNPEHEAYEYSEKGFEGNCEQVRLYADVPVLENCSLWGTVSPNVDPTSFSYYDEFDSQGNLRWDFMNNQIDKITRNVNRFAVIWAS